MTRKTYKKKDKKDLTKGGSSCGFSTTGQYGSAVYGAAGQQVAQPGGNAIQMNPVGGQMGGKKKEKRSKLVGKGGSMFADLGVPTLLLYAAATTRKSKSKSRKNRSYKKGRR